MDGHLEIGSLSNPGSSQWECQWGSESSKGSPAEATMSAAAGAFMEQLGDVHIYPAVPVTDQTASCSGPGAKQPNRFFFRVRRRQHPNAIRTVRWYEQVGARKDLAEVKLFAEMARRFEADWKKWGFDGVYTFPEDMLRDSERLHTRQRMIGFDMVRSNPKICGFNVTGMLDHGYVGEGVWTFWREWKPGTAEGFCDGWRRYGGACSSIRCTVIAAASSSLRPCWPMRTCWRRGSTRSA